MNVIMHIPHASTLIPEGFKDDFTVDQLHLTTEIDKMTDWYTDILFDTYFWNKLVFPVSRLVCDVERFENDADEKMARRGMGVCYTKDHDGNPLRSLTEERRQIILEEYYRSHHKNLERMVSSALRNRKCALIIDGHSFSPEPYKCDLDQTPDRPDFCIGIDEYHTPESLIEFTYDYFSQNGEYKVEINSPFTGTIVPQRYYLKNPKVHSIMIEINRSLYMQSDGTRKNTFYTIQSLVKGYIDRLYFCKDSHYELINLEYKNDFYRTVMECNQTITKFKSVEFLWDVGAKKHFRFSYVLDDGERTVQETCDHYLGTNHIFYENGKIHISNRAKKQLTDEYNRRKRA